MTSNVAASEGMHNLVFARLVRLAVTHSHSTVSGFGGDVFLDSVLSR